MEVIIPEVVFPEDEVRNKKKKEKAPSMIGYLFRVWFFLFIINIIKHAWLILVIILIWIIRLLV